MPEPEVRYDVELVGGPYDAADGLWWRGAGDELPPDEILVGTCPGFGDCGRHDCGMRHTAYWVHEWAQRAPTTHVLYVRQEACVLHGSTERGRAVYVIGGLGRPENFRSAVALSSPRHVSAPAPKTPVIAEAKPRCRCVLMPVAELRRRGLISEPKEES